MAIVTTYVCDVSGESSTNPDDFFHIRIISKPINGASYQEQHHISYLHKTVAERLGFKAVPKDQAPPEVTLEDKLTELVRGIVSDEVHDAVASAMNGR